MKGGAAPIMPPAIAIWWTKGGSQALDRVPMELQSLETLKHYKPIVSTRLQRVSMVTIVPAS